MAFRIRPPYRPFSVSKIRPLIHADNDTCQIPIRDHMFYESDLSFVLISYSVQVSGESARHTSGGSISDTNASQQSSTDILAAASVIRAGHSIAFLMRNVSLDGNARPQAGMAILS